MRKITVSVQDETYRQIRAWCAQRDTCISHVVQAFLNDLPNRKDGVSAPNGGENVSFEELHMIEMERLMRVVD